MDESPKFYTVNKCSRIITNALYDSFLLEFFWNQQNLACRVQQWFSKCIFPHAFQIPKEVNLRKLSGKQSSKKNYTIPMKFVKDPSYFSSIFPFLLNLKPDLSVDGVYLFLTSSELLGIRVLNMKPLGMMLFDILFFMRKMVFRSNNFIYRSPILDNSFLTIREFPYWVREHLIWHFHVAHVQYLATVKIPNAPSNIHIRIDMFRYYAQCLESVPEKGELRSLFIRMILDVYNIRNRLRQIEVRLSQ